MIVVSEHDTLDSEHDTGCRDVRDLADQFGVPMTKTNIKRLRAYRDAPGLRMVATRLTDKRGKPAADRLAELFTELLNGFLPVNKEVANG